MKVWGNEMAGRVLVLWGIVAGHISYSRSHVVAHWNKKREIFWRHAALFGLLILSVPAAFAINNYRPYGSYSKLFQGGTGWWPDEASAWQDGFNFYMWTWSVPAGTCKWEPNGTNMVGYTDGSGGFETQYLQTDVSVPSDQHYCAGNGVGVYGEFCGPRYAWDDFHHQCMQGYFLAPPSPPTVGGGQCTGEAKSGVPCINDPILPGSGNEYQTAVDYESGDGRLELMRSYNSIDPTNGVLSTGWQHNFADRRLIPLRNSISPHTGLKMALMSGIYPQPTGGTGGACSAQAWTDIVSNAPASMQLQAGTPTYDSTTGKCTAPGGIVLQVYSTDPGIVMSLNAPPTPYAVSVQRPDGSLYQFNCKGGTCTANSDIPLTLVPSSNGFTLTDEDDTVEQYDGNGALQSIIYRGGYNQMLYYSNGQLATVTDSLGRSLAFNYALNNSQQLASVATPDGTILYGYDSYGRLSQITYPDSHYKQYKYSDTQNLNALTSILDENQPTNPNQHPYATIIYDSTTGYATASAFGDLTALGGLGVHQSSIDYNNPTNPIVTDALGTSRIYHFTTINGRQKIVSITAPDGSPTSCNTCGAVAQSYDAAGYLSSTKDWNGNLTTYVYDDSRGLEVLRTEAANDTSATPDTRTITTLWETSFRLPHLISEYSGGSSSGAPTGILLRTTELDHDGSGNLIKKAITDYTTTSHPTQTWTYNSGGYTAWGAPKTIDGPRQPTDPGANGVNDLTQISYNECSSGMGCGQINTITDAYGHKTQFTSYDASGRPLTILDPNQVQTTLTYWPRGWIKTVTVGSNQAGGGRTTTFNYWPTGQIQEIDYPTGLVRSFFYNAAHQLADVYDRPVVSGNPATPPSNAGHIHYAVDAMDNVTGIDVYDSSGAHVQTHSRVYNNLNQLWKDVGAVATETTVYAFDNNSNLKQITDPLGRITKFNYDALNRLIQSIDPSTNPTNYTLNALDQLTAVQDPRQLWTTYTIDALDRVSQIASPDGGTTNQTAFDGAGNANTHTDANTNTTADQYDALNRLILRTRQDGSTVTLTWDQNDAAHGFGIGRPTRVVDTGTSGTSTTLDFKYDAWGRITQRKETIGSVVLTTSWTFDAATGQLQSLTLPSNAVVGYTWANGLITAMTLNGNSLVSAIAYIPFGGPTQWTLATTPGETDSRDYDMDGRIQSDPVESIGYDDASRVKGWTLATSALSGSVTFDYKLNTDFLNSYGFGSTSLSYDYDASGNRTLQTINGTKTTYTIDPGSNRIASSKKGILASQAYLYDNDGSRTGIKTVSLTYDASERLIASGSNATYVYDGLGERLKKKVGLATTLFAYDNDGHLIGEYNATGKSPLETIYLGDMPVALNNNGTTYFIHADYRNTPRQIDNAAGQAVWLWNPQPFGDNLPNNNPSGLGAFTYNLRFPGQYYDSESGFFYNYYRTYDPASGRYLEVDPLGLASGINPYIYAYANPLRWVDPLGLAGNEESESLRSGRAPLDPASYEDELISDNVSDLINQIRQYDPSYEYITAGPPGSRYNQADLNRLQQALQNAKDRGYCAASTPVGRRGYPLSVPAGTNSPANIGGRDYTGHALDRMQERGLTPSVVENTINTGSSAPGNMPGTTVYRDSANGTTAVTDSGSGRVITTY
jgi:RHS repeat-associated protein